MYIKQPEKIPPDFVPEFKFMNGTMVHVGRTIKKYKRSKELIRRWCMIYIKNLQLSNNPSEKEKEIIKNNNHLMYVTDHMTRLKSYKTAPETLIGPSVN